MSVKHYSVGDTISGGILEDCEAVVLKIERISATRDRVHYKMVGSFLHVDEADRNHVFFEKEHPDVLSSPRLDALVRHSQRIEEDDAPGYEEVNDMLAAATEAMNPVDPVAAKVFAESIGKRVSGSGYPGATIAGPPKEDPDGKLCVPLYTSDSEPDWIPIENLTIESE